MKTLTSLKASVVMMSFMFISSIALAGAGFGSGTSPVKNGSFGVDRLSQGAVNLGSLQIGSGQIPNLGNINNGKPSTTYKPKFNVIVPSGLESGAGFDNNSELQKAIQNIRAMNSSDGAGIGNLPIPESKVLFIQKEQSELVFDMVQPGEKAPQRYKQRPEEFVGQDVNVYEALKESYGTKTWAPVKGLSIRGQ